jgi:hypothetical protein
MNTTIEIKTEMWNDVMVQLIEDDDVNGFCTTCNCWADISRFQDTNGFCQPCRNCYRDEDWEDDLKYSDSDIEDKTNDELITQIDINNTRIEELKEDRRRDEEITRLVRLLTEEDFLKRFGIIEEPNIKPLKELLTKFERGIVMTCIDNNITKTDALHVMEAKYPRIYGVVSNNWDYYYNMYLKMKN